jgi:predicted DNA-binding ribbon-helix-helix protein
LRIAAAKGKSVKSVVIRKNIVVAGRKTSISLEEGFWKGLKDIARRHRVAQSVLLFGIRRCHPGSFSSAIRIFILDYYRERVPATSMGRSGSFVMAAAIVEHEVPAHG